MEDRIIINIDVMLAKRKMSVTELSEKVGITLANLSVLKLSSAVCTIRHRASLPCNFLLYII